MQRCLGCMREFGEEFDVCPHCGYIVGTGAASKNYLEPGTVLQNRYTLGKVLGQGGFGITYIAWDNKIGKAVAVKEYMPNAFASRVPGEKSVSCYNTQALAEFRSGLEKTRRETRTLARFNELESVVKVYDCFEENDTAYIVMELLRGKTVKEILTERERLSFDEVMRIMTPVLQTLDSMHSVGMIHRDVAPDNIFVCEDGKIKLLDFGAARVTSTSNEKTLSVILKQGYAPKEQYSGRGNQGAWTDVYAVCATMYRMLTGTTLPDSLSRTEDAAPDVAIPDSAKDALRKGLAVEPEKRTQSAGELLRALQKDLPQSSYAIDPRQFLDFEEKQKKRKRLRILLAAVAVILLLAAVAVAVVTAIQKPTTTTEPDETETASLLQAEAGTTEALPVVTEEELKQKLQKEVGDKEIVDFVYADYNGDGISEAFGLIQDKYKTKENYPTEITGNVYFVSNKMTEKMATCEGFYVRARKIPLTKNDNVFGYMTYREWGTGLEQIIYCVDNEGNPKNAHFASRKEIVFSEMGWFAGYKQAYGDRLMGRIYKEYYVYYDTDLCEFVEYGALEITKDQLYALDGAKEALEDISENKITSILYRENGIVDINYIDVDGDGDEIDRHKKLYIFNGKLGSYDLYDDYTRRNESTVAEEMGITWGDGYILDCSVDFGARVKYPESFPYDNSTKTTSLEQFIETYKKQYVGRHVPWWHGKNLYSDGSEEPTVFKTDYLDVDADGEKECLFTAEDDCLLANLQVFDYTDGYVWLVNEWDYEDYEDDINMIEIHQKEDNTCSVYKKSSYSNNEYIEQYIWRNGRWCVCQAERYDDSEKEYYAYDKKWLLMVDDSWAGEAYVIKKEEYEKNKQAMEADGKIVLTYDVSLKNDK